MLPKPFTRKELLAAEREPVGATVSRGKPRDRLALCAAPACVGLATLLHLSPVGPLFHPMGLFILGVVAAAWFGGAGPGVFAAFLSAIVLPHLIAVTYPLSLAYPLLAGFFDLPRFVTLGLTGAAVGWGTSSYRRAQAALRERERLLTKARDGLETAVAERTAHLSASEEALRRSEERFALALAASSDGIWDWDLVTDRQFFSERAQRMFGLEPGPVVRPRSEWDALREFHPEDAPRRRAAMERHLAGETPIYEGEWRLRPIRRRIPLGPRPAGLCVRDAAGRPIRMVGSVTDIDERKRIEAALRQSEERYSLALEATEEGHFDAHLDTDELFISERLNEIYGFPPGTRFAKRRPVPDAVRFYGNDAENYHAAVRAAEAKGGPERYEFEYRILRPSGEVRWLRTRGKVTRDAEGRARRRTGVVADITAAKLAEEALRESQERYALAVAGSDDGVWDCDFAARRIFVSARARELAGMPPGPEMVPMDEWFASLPIHPEDVPRRIAAMQAHLAGETPAYVGEFRLRQPDGVTAGAASTASACAMPTATRTAWRARSATSTPAGAPKRRCGSRKSATPSRMEAAEEGHFDSNLQTDEIFASAQVNEDLRLAATVRLPHSLRLPGARCRFHPDDWPRISAQWREAARQARAGRYDFEYRILAPARTTLDPRPLGKVFARRRGPPASCIGIVADITARKLAEEALRRKPGALRARGGRREVTASGTGTSSPACFTARREISR